MFAIESSDEGKSAGVVFPVLGAHTSLGISAISGGCCASIYTPTSETTFSSALNDISPQHTAYRE